MTTLDMTLDLDKPGDPDIKGLCYYWQIFPSQ